SAAKPSVVYLTAEGFWFVGCRRRTLEPPPEAGSGSTSVRRRRGRLRALLARGGGHGSPCGPGVVEVGVGMAAEMRPNVGAVLSEVAAHEGGAGRMRAIRMTAIRAGVRRVTPRRGRRSQYERREQRE